MTPLLNIQNLVVQYRSKAEAVTAVNNASLVIPERGYTIGIVGESGSGKTTLGSSIMNLVEPPGQILSGKVEFDGDDIFRMTKSELRRYRWASVSMVYQSAMNSLSPVKSIDDHIIEVLRQHLDISKSEAFERAIKLLIQVGIPEDRTHAYAHELSGGMKQRVVIAMALSLTPSLLIADEPTSALDVVIQRQILSMLKEYVLNFHLSLFFITHEISILEGLVDNIAVMHKGKIVEVGPTDKVLYEPLHPYTEKLLNSMLTVDTDSSILLNQGRMDTKRTGVEAGCNYADVCQYFMERCSAAQPELVEVKQGRWVACYRHS